MVLVLLVVMWVVVLTPSLLRSRARRRGDSVGSFRRQLTVIQRTGPAGTSVPGSPALGRLDPRVGASFPMSISKSVAFSPSPELNPAAEQARALARSVRGGAVGTGRGPGRLMGSGGVGNLRPVGDGPVARGSRPGSPRPLGATRASSARARTLQRRRQVLYTLAGAFVATLVLGAIPSLHLIWWVTGLSGIMLAAYVGILVHLRNLAAEREMKLRFLPARSIEPTMLLRRSAN